jgi:hypothetical protein
MDITAAFLLAWIPNRVHSVRLLQGIASGLLGRASFQHGWATGTLGLAFHFLIAFTAAAVFYTASRKLPALLDHPGSRASATRWWSTASCTGSSCRFPACTGIHPRLSYSVTAIVTHMVCVGLPISLVIHRFVRR